MKTFIALLVCTGVVASVNSTEFNEKAKRFILSFSSGGSGSGGGGTSSGCSDALNNCGSYDPSVCTNYKQWASENCQSTCNMCSSGSGGSPPIPPVPQIGSSSTCSDKLSNCGSYDPSVCSNSMYKEWASDNCAKTCNQCSGGGSGTGTGSGTSGGGTMTGTSSGCFYNSKLYQQGQTWNDACKYKCRCIDGNAGKYECRQLCLNWNLPPTCQMNPPSAGKCCPKPSCPSNIVLQYPDGYVEE